MVKEERVLLPMHISAFFLVTNVIYTLPPRALLNMRVSAEDDIWFTFDDPDRQEQKELEGNFLNNY